MTRRLAVHATKLVALVALAVPVAIAFNGCSAECVDKFDCRSLETNGDQYTCVSGKCEKGDPGGIVPDAGSGGGDAGGSAGGYAGGSAGGNAGGMAGGSAGGMAGGSAGGTAGGSAGGMAGGSAGGAVAPITYNLHLTGDQQNPPVTTARSGTGTVIVTALSDGGYTAAVAVTHDVPSGQVTGGHLHFEWATFNSNAGLISLTSATSPIAETLFISPANATAIAAGGAYVNVHTNANTGGEIRGQLILPTETLLIGHGTGAQQVPPQTHDGTSNIGLIVNTASGAAKYEAAWSADVVATLAHIHQGGPGVDGPVVLGFALDGGNFIAGAGTISPWPTDGGYYFNIHTADGGGTSGGLIRADLLAQ